MKQTSLRLTYSWCVKKRMKNNVIMWREAEKCGFPAPKKYYFVLTKLMVIEESNNMSSITALKEVSFVNIFRTVLLEKFNISWEASLHNSFINFGTAKNPVGLKLESKNSKNPTDKYFLKTN